MPDKEEILKKVRAVFEIEPRINPHSFPVQMAFSESDGAHTLESAMENIAAKKLALELAINAWFVFGVDGVINKIEVQA